MSTPSSHANGRWLRRAVRVTEYWPEEQTRDLYPGALRIPSGSGGSTVDAEHGGKPSYIRGRRVLLAEEDRATARLIRHRIESEGGTVDRHTSGPEALSAWLQAPYDLGIVQARMPGLLAREFLDRARESGMLDRPVLILGWPGNDQEVVDSFDRGAADYVKKPFSPDILMARLRRLLRTDEDADNA